MNVVEVIVPVITVSEANGGRKKKLKISGTTLYKGEHWGDKQRRHKKQKSKVAYFLNPHQSKLSLPCHIFLTRFAPRKLDKFDNLPMSLKYILDAICEIITQDFRPGRADNTDKINVTYAQVNSKEYAVKITIQMGLQDYHFRSD